MGITDLKCHFLYEITPFPFGNISDCAKTSDTSTAEKKRKKKIELKFENKQNCTVGVKMDQCKILLS